MVGHASVVLRASGSVPRQNGGHSSCMQIFIFSVRTVQQTVRSHRYSSGDGYGRARCCATTGALVGIAQCFVRRWIYVIHHPGWLSEEFYVFVHEGVDSAPELDSRPALLP